MSKTRNLGNLTDVLTAGSTYATGATPPQFDASTNLVTTAFAQRMGVQSSGITLATAPGTIPLSAMGGLLVGNTGAGTQTLPLASTVPAGTRISFFSAVIMTVARNGTDTINMNGSAVNSIIVGLGDTLTLEAYPVGSPNQWFAVAGSVQLQYSTAIFGSTLQTWQNLIGSRALGTTYTNATSRPIMVNVATTASASPGTIILTVAGIGLIGSSYTNAGAPAASIMAVVPPAATYAASVTSGTGTIVNWSEYR